MFNLQHPRSRLIEYILTGGLLLLAAGLWVWGTQFLPLNDAAYGFDWRVYFWGALKTGWPNYHVVDGLFNPPWTMLMLLPLGVLPFRVGWSLIALFTIAVLVLSVPRRSNGRLDIGLTLALLCSHWTLRQLVDGNLAGFVIAGYLLLLNGWRVASAWQIAAGILLVTAKYQEAWLTLMVLAIFMLRHWPWRRWVKAGLMVAAVAVPCLVLLGADWLQVLLPQSADGQTQFLSNIDPNWPIISLAALQIVAGVPEWVRWGLWLLVLSVTIACVIKARGDFSVSLVGCLLTASVLLAPYASGMSLTTVLAIGVAPLLRRHLLTGLALLAFSYGPLVTFVLGVAYDWPHVTQMAYLLAVWCALALHYLRDQTPMAALPNGERRVGPLTDHAS